MIPVVKIVNKNELRGRESRDQREATELSRDQREAKELSGTRKRKEKIEK